MSALVFLGVAVTVSIVGSVVVAMRHRRPTSVDRGIDDFAQRMKALSPDEQPLRRRGG